MDVREAIYGQAQRWRGMRQCGATCSKECLDASTRLLALIDAALADARAQGKVEALDEVISYTDNRIDAGVETRENAVEALEEARLEREGTAAALRELVEG